MTIPVLLRPPSYRNPLRFRGCRSWRSSQNFLPVFAPRQIDPSIPQTRLWLPRDAPVVLGLEQPWKGYGHTDPGSVVGPSRFPQRHTDFGILAESRRYPASGGTRPDDDVIKFLSRFHGWPLRRYSH